MTLGWVKPLLEKEIYINSRKASTVSVVYKFRLGNFLSYIIRIHNLKRRCAWDWLFNYNHTAFL